MKRHWLLAAISTVFCLMSWSASAQDVTCESVENRQTECPMNTQGNVRMIQQLSRSACTEGVTWGLFKHTVWVSGGCRAVFRNESQQAARPPGYGAGNHNNSPTSVTCESVGNQQVNCEMNTSGNVRVSQQLSRTACVEGQNWGLSKHSVWVSGGCRAVFTLDNRPLYAAPAATPVYGNGHVAGLPTHVICASEGGQRTECDMNTQGVVKMKVQLSRAACVEGDTWGLFKHSVWVSGGCRAEFVSGPQASAASGTSVPNVPRNEQIAACNAVQDRYGQMVSSTPLRPGAFEIILHYDDGEYVCNVNAENKVSYFEKTKR